MAHDEFRIRVQTERPKQLLDALRETSVGAEERAVLGRVATTHEQDHVFIYTDSEQAAGTVRVAVEQALSASGIAGELSVWRWHPIEERWEDASTPLPTTPAEQDVERVRLQHDEDAESQAAGYPEWEVRVSLPSHHDAQALAQRLQGEGLALQRQWRHVILGAEDEAQAQALAARVRFEAPDGSEVVVEGAGLPAWEALHPFAVFGGIAN
ncbi:MAG TPA: hypothetical protein VGF95_09515 [Solirubrobacteraceae bacterium]|jgi:hypothetical protein